MLPRQIRHSPFAPSCFRARNFSLSAAQTMSRVVKILASTSSRRSSRRRKEQVAPMSMKLEAVRQKTNQQKKRDLALRPRMRSKMQTAEAAQTPTSSRMRRRVWSSRSRVQWSAHSQREEERMQRGERRRLRPTSRTHPPIPTSHHSELTTHITFRSDCNISPVELPVTLVPSSTPQSDPITTHRIIGQGWKLIMQGNIVDSSIQVHSQ